MNAFGLTPRESDLLAFIRLRFAETGIMPCYEEMAAAIGVKSKSNICRLLAGLEQRGHIARIPGRSRALRLIETKPDARDALRVVLDQCRISEACAAELRALLTEAA